VNLRRHCSGEQVRQLIFSCNVGERRVLLQKFIDLQISLNQLLIQVLVTLATKLPLPTTRTHAGKKNNKPTSTGARKQKKKKKTSNNLHCIAFTLLSPQRDNKRITRALYAPQLLLRMEQLGA
jgi:hypothetical protein